MMESQSIRCQPEMQEGIVGIDALNSIEGNWKCMPMLEMESQLNEVLISCKELVSQS